MPSLSNDPQAATRERLPDGSTLERDADGEVLGVYVDGCAPWCPADQTWCVGVIEAREGAPLFTFECAACGRQWSADYAWNGAL